MRPLLAVAVLLIFTAVASAADPIAEARRLYNLGQYANAEKLVREMLAAPGRVDEARVILGRIQLERYRESANEADLKAARQSLTAVDPRSLGVRERVELMIGLAEALYLEERFGAAADLFESIFDRSAVLGASAHERVLDWWATAMDRQAKSRPVEDRGPFYQRILDRMRQEIVINQGSTAAGYWIAAAARASGHLEEAWYAATAGWVRAALADDRGATLRADLDRLMVQAIIPERAAKVARSGDSKAALASMFSEWEAFKEAWSK